VTWAEWARAVYAVGLLLAWLSLLACAVILGPPAARVLRDLTAALGATATALRSLTGEREAIARIEARAERIEEGVREVRELVGRR